MIFFFNIIKVFEWCGIRLYIIFSTLNVTAAEIIKGMMLLVQGAKQAKQSKMQRYNYSMWQTKRIRKDKCLIAD